MSGLLSTSIDQGVLMGCAKLLAKLYWCRQYDRADTTTGYLTFSHHRLLRVYAKFLLFGA